MAHNPYSAPESSVAPVAEPGNFELHEPRGVDAGRGVSWISEGFGFFKRDIGNWLIVCVVGFVLMLVLNLIPLVNFFAAFLSYVWIGGLMLGCKAQDDGEGITLSHLFAGFKNRFGSLLLLGVISMVLYLVIAVLAFSASSFDILGATMGSADPENMGAVILDDPFGGFFLPLLIAMAMFVPVLMLIWFAPALIVINDLPLFKAMSMSFKGCLKNVLPYVIYGVVMMVLYFLAVIPLGLGLLVLIPTSLASIYCSWKDIYINQD